MSKQILLMLVAAFLILTLILLRPPSPPITTPLNSEVKECGLNVSCFKSALAQKCRPATFLLSDPTNSTNYFLGRINGTAINRCRIDLKDPLLNKSMACYIDSSSLEEINSFYGLRSVCSGDLLNYILNHTQA